MIMKFIFVSLFIGGSCLRLATLEVDVVSSCSAKVSAQIGEWNRVINSKQCSGKKNARVCNGEAFANHLGKLDRARADKYLTRAITAQTKLPATPWLTLGNGAAFTGNGYLDFHIYSLFFQERQTPGTYVEMGGSNGVHASNTYFFDHALGWTGALIEPTACAVCQMPFNRPKATNINSGVCKEEKTMDFSFMKNFCSANQMAGCAYDYAHVPCAPMANLFAKAGLTHIDFFSLDIEGAWRDAWDTIDFKTTPIDVFLMECFDVKRDKTLCENLMTEKGYDFAWVGGNDILAWKPNVQPKICQ